MIRTTDLTPEQLTAVEDARGALHPADNRGCGDDPDTGEYPVVIGALIDTLFQGHYASFDRDPRRPGARWFSVQDVPVLGADYAGYRCVADEEGRPLGVAEHGPLVLHQIRGRWVCQPIGTEWAYWQDLARVAVVEVG